MMELDPWERCFEAGGLIEDLVTLTAALADLRTDSILEMRTAGATLAEIGEWTGLSTQRIDQLAKTQRRLPAPLDQAEPERVRKVPAALRTAAFAESERAAMALDTIGTLQRWTLRRGRGGEWDWFRALNPGERTRVSRKWMAPSEDAMSPDQAAPVIAKLAGLDASDLEACMAYWVNLTRLADAGRSVAKGRWPRPSDYGDVSAEQLFAISDLKSEEDEEATPWWAGLARCEIGASPVDMSYAEWTADCARCLDVLRAEEGEEWLSREGLDAHARYRELLPIGAGDGLYGRRLWRSVVTGYRLAHRAA